MPDKTLRPAGNSDKIFFYNGSGFVSSFNLQINIEFFQAANINILKNSFERALNLFPEFNVIPVIKNNSIFFAENNNPIPVLESDSLINFGTDDTNGYLFCIKANERGFTFSSFHGLSDYWGILYFVRTALYFYAHDIGIINDTGNIRTKHEYLSMDEQEREDPYKKFADPSQKSFWEYKHKGAFAIPEKTFAPDVDYMRIFDITCPLSPLLNISKNFSTSLMPLLTILVSEAITEIYSVDGLPVLAMMPVNLRPYYETKTVANFSDGVLVQYEHGLQKYSREKQALILRARMDLQLQKENFDVLLARKVELTEGYSRSEKSIYDLAREITKITVPSKDDFNFMTYAFTYPGKLEFNSELVKHASILLCTRMSVPMGLYAASYGDELSIKIAHSFDNDVISRAVYEKIKSLGIPANIRDMGHVAGDKLILEKLKKS